MFWVAMMLPGCHSLACMAEERVCRIRFPPLHIQVGTIACASLICVHYAQSAPSMPLGACPDCRRTLYILTMTADKDDDTDDPPK